MGNLCAGAPSNTLEDNYTIGEKLGEGQFAEVFLGTRKKGTQTKVAIKLIDRSKSRTENLEAEIDLLKRFGTHDNIVQLFDVYDTENQVQMCMEWMAGGELFDHLVEQGPYTEQKACKLLTGIGDALIFLHENGCCHRDLKPENLLLSNRQSNAVLKIADFGLSKIIPDTGNGLLKTACGTWAYAAPEVLEIKDKGTGGYNEAADMWAVGVIIFVLLAGYHPFDVTGGSSDTQMQSDIKKGKWNFDDPAWKDVTLDAKDMITKLLQKNPDDRLTAQDLLEHSWFSGGMSRTWSKITLPGQNDIGITVSLEEYRKGLRRKLKGTILVVNAAMAFKTAGSQRFSARDVLKAAANEVVRDTNNVTSTSTGDVVVEVGNANEGSD